MTPYKSFSKFIDLDEAYHKSSIKPLRGLIETGVLFSLVEMMVSVPHKALEYKMEKLKYKLVVMQPRIKNKSELPVGEY